MCVTNAIGTGMSNDTYKWSIGNKSLSPHHVSWEDNLHGINSITPWA